MNYKNLNYEIETLYPSMLSMNYKNLNYVETTPTIKGRCARIEASMNYKNLNYEIETNAGFMAWHLWQDDEL